MTVDQLLRALRPIVPFDERALSTGQAALQQTCTGVTHDSRRVTPGTVFVALRGLKMDGAEFAQQAIAAGAAAIVSERAAVRTVGVPWITVADARLALAHLAAEFNGHPSHQMRVVGITGTNGKTTTGYLRERDPGSCGNQVRADGDRALSSSAIATSRRRARLPKRLTCRGSCARC